MNVYFKSHWDLARGYTKTLYIMIPPRGIEAVVFLLLYFPSGGVKEIAGSAA